MKPSPSALRQLLSTALTAVLLVSCAPAATVAPAPTAAPEATAAPAVEPTAAPVEPTAAPTEAPAQAPAGDQTLIVYTNSGSDGRGDWLKERAAQDGFSIVYVQLGGGDLANRIVAEKNNQIADLVFGLNAVEYEKLKAQDLLLQYEPSWAKEVDMSLGDADGYYYPIVVQPLLLVYNPEFVTADAAPQDWTDLANPEFKDKTTLLGLGGGTAKTILSSILVRYADPNGTYGISDEGWSVITAIIQNQHITTEGEDFWGNAVSGTHPMLMMWGSGLIQNEKSLGVDFEVMTPEVGVPFVVEQVAIFKNSQKTELARQFVDWFGSAKIQGEWSAKFGSTPAQPEALKAASAEVNALMTTVKPQPIDWGFVAENIDKWMEKIQLEAVE